MLWSLCYAGILTAFLVGLVQRRLLIADALARLSDTLNSTLEVTQLRVGLASALGDDTLELLFWNDRRRGWFSTDGRCTVPPSRPGRTIAKIDDDGSRFALLLLDPALEADDELLDAVGAHARDLHDGTQQRLVALRIKASLAEGLLRDDPVAASAKVHELGRDLELALDEVRALARGVYPSLLADRGIEDALRNAVRGSPLVATISAHGVARYPAEVERAVNFTCLEALQNTIKHARGATRLAIALRGNGTLDFEVHDDGCGFMPTPLHDSGGLSNMRDRVEAVGGQLTVDSTPGAGTRILGTIPVAAPAAPAPPTP